MIVQHILTFVILNNNTNYFIQQLNGRQKIFNYKNNSSEFAVTTFHELRANEIKFFLPHIFVL